MNHETATPFHRFKNKKQVTLRDIEGHDENYIIENLEKIPHYRLATGLFERILIQDNKKGDQTTIRNFTIGDRTVILLHLRRKLFGDKIHCMFLCEKCNESASLEISIGKLFQAIREQPQCSDVIKVGKFTLKLRPITTRDVEESLEIDDKVTAMKYLAKASIVSAQPELPDSVSDELLDEISSHLEKIDPFADLILNLTCPSCNHSFETSFFVEDFVFHEIVKSRDQLEKDVNLIAMNYHWSEEDILTLTRNKRKRYVELINTSVSET